MMPIQSIGSAQLVRMQSAQQARRGASRDAKSQRRDEERKIEARHEKKNAAIDRGDAAEGSTVRGGLLGAVFGSLGMSLGAVFGAIKGLLNRRAEADLHFETGLVELEIEDLRTASEEAVEAAGRAEDQIDQASKIAGELRRAIRTQANQSA